MQARIAKLAPGGRCLPKERRIDLTKVSCGRPDDYWECGVDEEGRAVENFSFVEEHSDPRPLAEPKTEADFMALFECR